MDQDIFVSSLTHGSTFSRIDGWLAMFLKNVKSTITRKDIYSSGTIC